MFTLRQLKYFVAATETGRVTAAARQLHISQSAVTTAIRELEELLGYSLLERSRLGVNPTEAGRRFLSHANSVLALADEAMAMPAELVDVSGTIRLAATYTLVGYFLPHHWRRFRLRYQSIKLEVDELTRADAERSLLEGRHDLALVITGNIASPELARETYLGSERRLWVGTKHPLLEESNVGLRRVAAEPYIMLTVDEAQDSAMRYWSAARQQPKVVLRTSSVEAVRSMVADGLGITILSDMVYRPWSLEGKRIETITLRDTIPKLEVGLAWNKNAPTSKAMAAFRSYLRAHYTAPQVVHVRSRA